MTLLRRWLKAAAFAALLVLVAPISTVIDAQGQSNPPAAASSAQPRPAAIDRNGVLILIRATLAALDQANATGNYTVLRDLGAPAFAEANSAARLGEIFASQRAQKLDLSGALVLDPQLTLLPQIETSGLLHLAGFFPSVPTQVNFELLYAPVDSRWRLFGVSVTLGSAAPTAPDAKVSSPAPPSPQGVAPPIKPTPPAPSKR